MVRIKTPLDNTDDYALEPVRAREDKCSSGRFSGSNGQQKLNLQAWAMRLSRYNLASTARHTHVCPRCSYRSDRVATGLCCRYPSHISFTLVRVTRYGMVFISNLLCMRPHLRPGHQQQLSVTSASIAVASMTLNLTDGCDHEPG